MKSKRIFKIILYINLTGIAAGAQSPNSQGSNSSNSNSQSSSASDSSSQPNNSSSPSVTSDPRTASTGSVSKDTEGRRKTPARKKKSRVEAADAVAPTEPIILGVPRMQNSVYDYHVLEKSTTAKNKITVGFSTYQPTNYRASSILFQPSAFRSDSLPELTVAWSSPIFENRLLGLEQRLGLSFLQLDRSGTSGIAGDSPYHQQMNLVTGRYGVSKAFTVWGLGEHLKPLIGADLAAMWAEAESGPFGNSGISQVYLAHSERAGLGYTWDNWAAELGAEARFGFSSSLVNGTGAYLNLSVRL